MASDRTRKKARSFIQATTSWTLEDYRLLAQFMLYPDVRKLYRRHYDMIEKLADTLAQLDGMRDSREQRLSFFIGNRMAYVGDWYAKYHKHEDV